MSIAARKRRKDCQVLTFVPTDSTKISAPRSACRELLLTVVQDLPPSLVEPDTLSKMCHLVTDTAESVQRMAYQVLQGAAAKRTEHLVIESAVDTEDEFKAELPAELLELLSRLIDPEDAEQDEQVCRMFWKEGRRGNRSFTERLWPPSRLDACIRFV